MWNGIVNGQRNTCLTSSRWERRAGNTKKDDLEVVWAHIVLKCPYLAIIGRPDTLGTVHSCHVGDEKLTITSWVWFKKPFLQLICNDRWCLTNSTIMEHSCRFRGRAKKTNSSFSPQYRNRNNLLGRGIANGSFASCDFTGMRCRCPVTR